jgi:hypothetical protein
MHAVAAATDIVSHLSLRTLCCTRAFGAAMASRTSIELARAFVEIKKSSRQALLVRIAEELSANDGVGDDWTNSWLS